MIGRIFILALIIFLLLGGGAYLLNFAKHNFTIALSDKKLSPHRTMNEQLIVLGSTFTAEGTLRKPVVLINSRLLCKKKANILGDILAWNSTILAEKGSRIGGNIFGMNSRVSFHKGSKFSGRERYLSSAVLDNERLAGSLLKDKILLRISRKIHLVSFLIIFLISFLHMFFNRQFLRVAYTLYAKPFWSFGSAVLGTIVISASVIWLLSYPLGRYAALMLLILTLFLGIQGLTASAIIFGKFFRKTLWLKVNWIWLEILLGLIFMWALKLIPLAGNYIFCLLVFVGTGAAIYSLFGSREV